MQSTQCPRKLLKECSMVGQVCVMEEDPIAQCSDIMSTEQKDSHGFAQYEIEHGLRRPNFCTHCHCINSRGHLPAIRCDKGAGSSAGEAMQVVLVAILLLNADSLITVRFNAREE